MNQGVRKCDRCDAPLGKRTPAFFNRDILCQACAGREKEIQRELIRRSIDLPLLANCGYVPTI